MNAFMGELGDDELEALKEAMQREEEERVERLDALGRAIAEKRSEAIAARAASGIEQQWQEDEEYYEGIDEANRHESAFAEPGEAMPSNVATASTIFLNITGPYCDAASASLADMLLPTDDSAWHITNTPVPELIPFAEGKIPPNVQGQIEQEANQYSQDPAQVQARIQQTSGKLIDEAKQMLDQAKEKAEKAQKRIEDWHVECQYHAEVRKVIEDAGKVGSGVLKGPVPAHRRQIAYKDGALVIQDEIKPVSKRVDYRNFFPDGGCGDSIHSGSYVFERDDITTKQLRELIGTPGYEESQILAVLEEGPTEAQKEYASPEDMERRDTKSLYEIWYYYGDLEKDDLEAAGCECEEDQETVPAQIVMVNNRVIKGAVNPLDTGEFPYDVMIWKKRNGSPWGTGNAHLIRTPQRMINGAGRNLMDNAGLAGGPMWAFKQGIVEPIDGVVELSPRKGWKVNEDADIEDVSKAFTYFKLDMMVSELQAIIYLGLKMAEDVTGLPMIMQGQMGAQKLDTLGQTQLLNNNANIVRRRIARLFDDLVTEPHVRRYYAYLLQYGEDDEKGEFIIDARGSSNLVERAAQKEKALELLQLAQNPVFGIDPKKAAKEVLRSEKYDPKAFEFDDEEWQQIVAKMAAPEANDPRQAIAEMNSQLKMEIEKLKADKDVSITDKKIQHEKELKSADIQSDERIAAMKVEIDKAVTLFEGDLKKQLAEMEYQGDKDLQFDKLKTQLNETVMRLTTQKELSGMNALAKNMPKPPTEPAGRAPVGRSYQQ